MGKLLHAATAMQKQSSEEICAELASADTTYLCILHHVARTRRVRPADGDHTEVELLAVYLKELRRRRERIIMYAVQVRLKGPYI